MYINYLNQDLRVSTDMHEEPIIKVFTMAKLSKKKILAKMNQAQVSKLNNKECSKQILFHSEMMLA